jgi:hypothetical protein
LAEVLIGVVIITVLMSISGLAFRRLTESTILAQSRNAVLTYAQVARSYAVANHLETMLVFNPHNGRFEMWYLNPPAQGGSWDPQSSGDPDGTATDWLERTDGYMFAPVLNSSASLPLDGRGRPAALVSPIDYGESVYRPAPSSDPGGRYMDNLTWAALCFDEDGHLVVRTRRIATRLYHLPNGAPNPNANRLVDETPDLTRVPLVVGGANGDTPITSTRGLVISDYAKLRSVLSEANASPRDLVQGWLRLTRPGQRYANHAVTVVLNRFSGHRLAEDF